MSAAGVTLRPMSPPARTPTRLVPESLSAEDVAAFVHLAEDTDGVPLPDELRAFISGAIDDVLRFDGWRLVVFGIAGPSYYPPAQMRAAVADAFRVCRVIHPGRRLSWTMMRIITEKA